MRRARQRGDGIGRNAWVAAVVGAVLLASCGNGTGGSGEAEVDPSVTVAETTVVPSAPDPTEPQPTSGPMMPASTVPDATGEVRFAVIGDFGTDCCGEGPVAATVADWSPQFIVTTGDNRYDDLGSDRAIGKYYADYIGDYSGDYGTGAETNRFFPVAGNHDYSSPGGVDEYLDYFDLPGARVATTDTSGNERYYDFVEGPVHFFMLNSNDEEPDGTDESSAQADWLRAQLASSQSPWQIVVLHHPPFSSGDHGATERAQWPFADWGVDVVISGHDHSYERLTKGDLTYIVDGSGGRTLRGVGDDPDPDSEIFYADDYGALFVKGCAARLDFEFRSASEGSIDQFSLGDATC
jgi:tartrate-resistant acid phosphatase type 5